MKITPPSWDDAQFENVQPEVKMFPLLTYIGGLPVK